MQLIQERKCEACGMNPVGGRARKCESCKVALRRVEGTFAVYRHRVRSSNGKARHNSTYGGKPTKWVIDRAIEVLRSSGVLK